MDKNKMWKWLLLGGLLVCSIWMITPPGDVKDDKGNIVKKGKIKLGLDLQGGSSFIVQVDREDVQKKLKESGSDVSLEKQIEQVRESAVEMIRRRVDISGTAEAEIYPEGKDRINVRLPGVAAEAHDATREMIEKDGVLVFKLVDINSNEYVGKLLTEHPAPEGFVLGAGYYLREKGAPKLTREDYEKLKDYGDFPADLMLEKETLEDGTEIYRPIFIETRIMMTGADITSAQTGTDPITGGLTVDLKFGKEGTKNFADLTREYAATESRSGRQLAIILDDVFYSAPVLKVPILNGAAVISGNFSAEDVKQLANILRAGSMPGRVRVIEELTIDPTLGKASVESGVSAIIWGGISVLVFMGVYYLVPGLIANASLIFMLLLLPVGMKLAAGFLGVASGSLEGSDSVGLPTLTLYGIAGIVLTVGMAVDANVLTFERMREEWKVGKSISGAINAGYNKALSTILDANVTTLLTAVILYITGSGPIRGFAVTLSAGILVSMFIVLVITRMIFSTLAEKGLLKSIKMLSLPFLANAKVDFVGKRKIAAILSLVLIFGSWAWFAKKGPANFGIDFTGGTVIPFTFAEKQDSDVVRSALEEAGFTSAKIDYQTKKDGTQFLEVKVKESDEVSVQRAVDTVKQLPGSYDEDKKGEYVSVGSQIGDELKSRSIKAIIFALIGIIIYISIRFEFAFAMGAIVALAHDVLITVGLFCLLGRELSMPIIAALLTIVGYSVNDTIVVFDRIREDLKLEKGKSYKEIANLSINQTLSRTLLTSITTLLTVVMLLVLGGGAVNDFALALFIGILVGTYSSVFIATPVALLWHKEEGKEEKVVTE
ncbi:MAG: protein translocase subunit SecD [Pontiellaceae bacterium]|nr:protein translocase subunit SecD [Pontiellaceae bacterium]